VGDEEQDEQTPPGWTRETLTTVDSDNFYHSRLFSLVQVQYGPTPAMVEYRSRKYTHPVHIMHWMTKVFVKTWCADNHTWKVRTCHAAMTPTFTRESGVEDAGRQAYYSHRDMMFSTIENDNDRYFPRRRAEASGCRIAKIEEGESARLVETVPLVVALNSALDKS
jgi:hypothetical protein